MKQHGADWSTPRTEERAPYASIPLRDHIERAKRLAEIAHAGQVDKAGRPYIDHPATVANLVRYVPECRDLSPEDQVHAEIAAWLHDVIEDTPITDPLLRELGFPREAVTAVTLLTFVSTAETREDYYERLASYPIAQVVKIADVAHNMQEARLALLDEQIQDRLRRKYRHALRCIVGREDPFRRGAR